MTDDQHGEGTSQGGGRWNPLPQGDYDDGATAFVKLPEGGIEALLSGDSPLAAPGHGYVPPQITVAPGTGDPAATGAWTTPDGGDRWPDPNAADPGQAPDPDPDDRFTYRPGATQHWTFEEPAPAGPGHDVTGQWSIPVAGGDLPDESGEFTTSSLVEQWGAGAPATLPGGAPAPWATDGAGTAWAQPGPQAPAEPGHTGGHPAGPAPATDGYVPEVPEERYGHDPAARHAGHPGTGRDGLPAQAAPAGHDEPEAQPAAPSAGPGADPHAPAEGAERPADGPAGPEGPGAPDGAPRAATAADAADAVDTADADVTGADTPEDPAEASAPAEDADGADSAASPEDTAKDPAAEPLPPHDDHPLASYVLRVNGTDRPVTGAWIGESLLYVLRERLGLAGAKDGCSQGECGACNVQVDGRLVASCLVPAVTAAGSEVRTVEGLAADGRPSDVQRALARCGAVQCGFCVPGMAMTVHDLLEGNPAPTELETRQALCGNLCRCSGYRGVLDAVQEVVAEREATHAGAGADSDEARIPHQAGPGSGGVHPSAFEAPGAFDPPHAAPGGYGDTQGGYGDTQGGYGDGPDGYGDGPDPYDAPDPYGPQGPHDQHYGQDGGQA
ncbi:2Fe-2S iron-sulfur cluster-binding protein [Streptomyces sp. NPDC059688]|uniref:2Fe-2S iron-sulfur cluster-binding protein n=1 Tax=Streptomyces sp. NPDC059688 TaxID=3346906 RepID=UPI0036846229